MISSMTAFARKMDQTSLGQLTWEVRSVNHRYLEINLRLPEQLRAAEKGARDLLASVLKRGKVDVFLKFQPGEEVPFDIKINQALIKQLASAEQQIRKNFANLNVNFTDVLSWPGVLQTEETRMEQVVENALSLLKNVITELVAVREREGEGIKNFMLDRLKVIEEQIKIVEKRLPQMQNAMREKIMARFEELKLTPDNERVEQEMIFLLQKMDVAEELQRLPAHLNEVRRNLKGGVAVGRRLDFLMQELNREANTLGSKVLDVEVTQAVVEIKVQIEQMREQVQNIE